VQDKIKGLFYAKYVFSDDDTSFPNGLNEKTIIKKLEKKSVARDQLFKDKDDLLKKERKNTCELKKFLKFEKEK
jgi:hypothetical protein